MSTWQWKPSQARSVWCFGIPALRPFVASAPWITICLLVLMFHIVGGTMTVANGVLFELPAADIADGETSGPVALVVPVDRETFVFFDDSRYLLGDQSSLAAFSEHLAERMTRVERKTLLVLADRRVAGGDLMTLSEIARRGGAKKILFAEKRSGSGE